MGGLKYSSSSLLGRIKITKVRFSFFSAILIIAHGTKARAATLPKLTTVQETKLKYLSLCTMARKARMLPYAQLQEALDIHVLRDLEDLIIDAMYQDVIRGRLDQRQSTFEVEWSMGRDMQKEDVQALLDQLHNWSKMTGALLESMDKKIKKIKDEQSQGENLRARQNLMLREHVREISEKIIPSAGNRAFRKATRGETAIDEMDVDDRSGVLGLTLLKKSAGPSSSTARSL